MGKLPEKSWRRAGKSMDEADNYVLIGRNFYLLSSKIAVAFTPLQENAVCFEFRKKLFTFPVESLTSSFLPQERLEIVSTSKREKQETCANDCNVRCVWRINHAIIVASQMGAMLQIDNPFCIRKYFEFKAF